MADLHEKTHVASEPSLLDRLDLLLLRLAKRGRKRYAREIDFYESFFAEHDLRKYVLDVRNAWRFGVIARVIDKSFPDGATVADVGCGLGSALVFLSRKHSYIGIDVSAASLEQARRIHAGADARFESGALPDLRLDSETVDVALCLEVLEHLPDDELALGELARIIRPGGLLFVSVPSSYFWPEYERLIGHVRHYDAERLTALVERHGFRVTTRLQQHRAFWRGYHYAYLGLRLADAVGRRLRPNFTMYETRPYRALSRSALKRFRRLEDSEDSASTFVVCARTQPSGS